MKSEPEDSNPSEIEILERCKSGAFGVVWKAQQGGREVAVKVIHNAISQTTLAMNHFRALTRVDGHRNVFVSSVFRICVCLDQTVQCRRSLWSGLTAQPWKSDSVAHSSPITW